MHDDLSVTTPTCNNRCSSGIGRKAVDPVLMTTERSHERLCEHAVNLGGCQRSRILAGLRKGVKMGCEVALDGMRCCGATAVSIMCDLETKKTCEEGRWSSSDLEIILIFCRGELCTSRLD